MISIIKYSEENGIHSVLPEQLKKWDYRCSEKLWVDIYNEDEKNSQKILSEVFDFHPLAIEDALKYMKDNKVHYPKIDDFENYLFIVFNGLKGDENTFKYNIFSLSCFLGHNFLVTIHNEKGENTVTKNLKSILNPRSFKNGPDYILDLILDEIVDRYYPILDNIEIEIEKTEQQLFGENPENTMLKRIMSLKKELIKLRRISSYQKEVLFKLTRGDSDLISLEESVYYRNVYDHLVRVSDTTESYRDYVAGMLDSYLSIVNNKMNEVMKFLATITTIGLPLTVITGIFGMNFDFISDLGFWICLVVMLLVVIFMILWFKKKNYI